MTAQIGDVFKYKNHDYKIVAINKPISFSPEEYGITPESCCSACWTGYWCNYNISDEGIVLENLYINSHEDYYPDINGVKVKGSKKNAFEYMGHHYYEGVNIKMDYTGRILVGKDFLRGYYIHMGYQRAWAYEELKELVFENGALIEVIDHSHIAKEIRERIENEPDFMGKLSFDIPIFEDGGIDLGFEEKTWWLG